MKFAVVNGERREAEKGISGVCIGCEQPMISKCGPIKVKHWAHKSNCECDHWWENETEWHRGWKNNFPKECQEIRHKAESGEWHIADVVTKHGHFIEFQHSFLNTVERQARNKFYGGPLVWVVDGLKRKNDFLKFEQILKEARRLAPNSLIAKLPSFGDEQPLLRDWSDCSVPIFFDFGSHLPLWCLLPKSTKGQFYILPFARDYFVALLNGIATDGQSFSGIMKTITDSIFIFENPQQIINPNFVVPMRQQPVQRPIEMPKNPSRKFINFVNRSPRGTFRF